MPHPTRSKLRRAFTLVELMISIGLVLVIVLGVNTVFSLTSKTVGDGQALSTISRDNRSAQAIVFQDLRTAVVRDAPCFMIRSQRTWAWRDRQDRVLDRDGNIKTIDINGDNTEGNAPGETIAAFSYGRRNYRSDRVGFFARDLYYSQTGSGANFIDLVNNIPVSSTEAWIVYGHLKLPDNSFSNTTYQLPGTGNEGSNPFNFYATQWVLGRAVNLLLPNPTVGQFIKRGTSQSPLSENSASGDGNKIQWCRYDIAQADIEVYRKYLPTTTTTDYWTPLIGFWYQGNPFPAKPLSSQGAAQIAPCFIYACTQFMVDYAGDFMTQEPATGKPLLLKPDGVVDFIVENGARRVRWYGFPRDVNDDGVIGINDVVPMKDVLATGTTGVTQAPWEKKVPTGGPSYASMADADQYIVAWGQEQLPTEIVYEVSRPTMLRFTLTIDDASGRVAGGQTFEYVADVR